jgi:putative nucleotidyltransferase with HDIG domain
MKKRIDIQDLRKGMYVTELDRPWLGTPFLFQGFEVTTDEELTQLRSLCRFVYVLEGDPRVAVGPRRSSFKSPAPAPVKETVSNEREILTTGVRSETTLPASGSPAHHYPDLTLVEEELDAAREINHEARETLFSILDDAKLGHSLDTPRAKKVVSQMTESILRNPDALVWLTQLKNKHEYTATHSLRVCVLALAMGRHLGYDRDKLNVLGTGALLHDIGKLKVPNELLDKPESLTREEFEIMKSHVPEGLKLLDSAVGIPAPALEVVGRHHERYSGNGYIYRLSGDSIGEFGLVSGIVDTYDAITSDRAYHLSLSAADALKIIYEGRTRAFHPWLVEQFIQCMGIFPIGSVVEMSTGSIGVVITANRQRRLRPRVALTLSPDRQPYTPATILDLMHVTHDTNGKPLEIRKVLPAGSFDINPTEYMPVKH